MLRERLRPNQSQTGTGSFFASLQDSFNKTFIVEDRYKLVLEGLWTTIVISMLSLFFGSLLGAPNLCHAQVPVKDRIRTGDCLYSIDSGGANSS